MSLLLQPTPTTGISKTRTQSDYVSTAFLPIALLLQCGIDHCMSVSAIESDQNFEDGLKYGSGDTKMCAEACHVLLELEGV
jgi:hypothetical protein